VRWRALCFHMKNNDWIVKEKPYDLRERLFLFACIIVRVVQYLHTRGPITKALCAQLLKSGTSAGANYEEADDGSSPRDKLAKRKIVLRELKETSFRLRVLRRCGFLGEAHDPVLAENAELVRILAKLVSNDSAKESGGSN
jgi:four helix bundle protein